MDVFKMFVLCIMLCALHVVNIWASSNQPNTTINTYKMHEQCGETINMKWKSIYTAEVTFNFDRDQYTPSHGASVDKGDKYSLPVICELSIESWDFLNRLMVVFEKMNIETNCGDTYLEVLDGPGAHSPPVKGLPTSLCERHVPRVLSVPYTTSDKHLTIRVHGNPDRKHKLQFTFLVVAFHEGNCQSYEYNCVRSNRCIMDDLVCNGHNPCGDHSDCPTETGTPREATDEESHVLLAALVALSATLVALLVGILVFCHYYRKRRKHLRQQHYHSAYGRASNQMHISVSPSSQLERSVSQIEAERRLAPPPYSTLETAHEENQSEFTSVEHETPNDAETPNDDALSCLEPDDRNPPSYACVMSHQDEFNLSNLDLHRTSTSNEDT